MTPGQIILGTRDPPLEKMTPFKCTAAVKGITVFKEVHTNEAQKELGESTQREKNQLNVYMQVKHAQIKGLGFMFNTYTPIVIS